MLIYLTEGEVHATIGDSQYVSQEEEMLVVAAGQIFSIDTYGPDRINRGFLLQFDAGRLNQYAFLDAIGNPRIRFDRLDARCTEGELNGMYTLYTSPWVHDWQRFNFQSLVSVLHWMEMHYRPLFFRANEKGRELTQRFRTLLHQHHLSKQRVSEYAELLDVTPNHLNKVVKETTSRPPTRWIDGAIVAEAKLLLVQPALSVAEVAARVGMDDASYFTRVFGKYVGMTPGEWRVFLGVGGK